MRARAHRRGGVGVRGILVALAALAFVPSAFAQATARGRALAEAQCGGCHAVGRAGASRVVAAPAFRDLHRRYPVEDLAEALAEGITTGHPGMPEFRLDPAEIDDLIAYLRTLER